MERKKSPSMEFQTPSSGIDIYNCIFLPQTIKDWDALPESVISSTEVADDLLLLLRG